MNYLAAELTRYHLEVSLQCEAELRGTNPKEIRKDFITTDKLKVQKDFLGSAVNKIVKRKLTSNLISSDVAVNTSEDLLYATEILLKARKICVNTV